MTFIIHGRDPRSGRPWELNFNALAIGTGKKNSFRGRPALLTRLMPGIQAHVKGVAQSSAYREKIQLYYFWHFLDYLENLSATMHGANPVVIDNLDWREIETVWRQFITWIRGQPADKMSPRTRYYLNASIFSIWKRAFDAAIESGSTEKDHLDIYLYFKANKSTSYGGDPLDFEEAKAAFRVLAVTWRAILKRIDRGRSLAQTGSNPMVGSGGGRTWRLMANRLWAAQHFLLNDRPSDEQQTAKLRWGFAEYPINDEWRIAGLEHVKSGFNAYLPCICLTRAEIAVAMAMVC